MLLLLLLLYISRAGDSSLIFEWRQLHLLLEDLISSPSNIKFTKNKLHENVQQLLGCIAFYGSIKGPQLMQFSPFHGGWSGEASCQLIEIPISANRILWLENASFHWKLILSIDISWLYLVAGNENWQLRDEGFGHCACPEMESNNISSIAWAHRHNASD